MNLCVLDGPTTTQPWSLPQRESATPEVALAFGGTATQPESDLQEVGNQARRRRERSKHNLCTIKMHAQTAPNNDSPQNVKHLPAQMNSSQSGPIDSSSSSIHVPR